MSAVTHTLYFVVVCHYAWRLYSNVSNISCLVMHGTTVSGDRIAVDPMIGNGQLPVAVADVPWSQSHSCLLAVPVQLHKNDHLRMGRKIWIYSC